MGNLFTRNNDALDRFLFANINPLYTAIFRIILCLFIFWIFILKGSYDTQILKLHSSYPEIYEQNVLFWYKLACSITLFLFGIGFKSRLFGLVSAILFIPLIYQHGFGTSRRLLALALFSFSLLRCDQLLSVKRLLNKTGDIIASPIWPIRLIQIELSLLYGVNAILKSTPDFLRGEVLRIQSIILGNFRVDLSDGYLDLGFKTIPVMILAICTVLSEYFLAIGFWFKRTRIFTVVFGIAFHLILIQVINIGNLDIVSVFLYLVFLIKWERPYYQR
jgi:hypothetical protein